MRRPACLLALAATSATVATACTPSSPVYFGPPRVVLQGTVQILEEQRVIPNAEVCVFGTDTLCVSTDQSGVYHAGMASGVLLEGNSLTVRFRAHGLPTAIAELEDVVLGEPQTVDCAISNRFTVSTRPVACLTVQH